MLARIALAMMIAVIVYTQGVKPLVADYYATKKNFAKALEWNPNDSTLHFKTGNIIRAIETNNGDLTQYALWTHLAIRIAQQGNKESATQAINKALWYYPDFKAAKQVAEALKK